MLPFQSLTLAVKLPEAYSESCYKHHFLCYELWSSSKLFAMGRQDYVPPSRDEPHSSRNSTYKLRQDYAPPSRDEPNSARNSTYRSRQEYLPPSRDDAMPSRHTTQKPPRLVSQECPPPVRAVDDLNSARNSMYKSRHISYDFPPPSRDYDDFKASRNSTYKPRHVSQDYPPPSRDLEDLDSARNSTYKSRHVSMQSRVDSLSGDSIFDGRSKRDTAPDIPAIYNHNGMRSTSFLMDQSTIQNSGPEWMSDRHSLVGPDRKSTRLNSSHSGESRMPSSA